MAHDFWNGVEKVVCVIPFAPAGAGKGRRDLAQTLSHTRKAGRGMERQQSFLRLHIYGVPARAQRSGPRRERRSKEANGVLPPGGNGGERTLRRRGAKGIYNPRPSSSVQPQRHQWGNSLRRSFSAARLVFFARFSVKWKCIAVSGMGCLSPSVKP